MTGHVKLNLLDISIAFVIFYRRRDFIITDILISALDRVLQTGEVNGFDAEALHS